MRQMYVQNILHKQQLSLKKLQKKKETIYPTKFLEPITVMLLISNPNFLCCKLEIFPSSFTQLLE